MRAIERRLKEENGCAILLFAVNPSLGSTGLSFTDLCDRVDAVYLIFIFPSCGTLLLSPPFAAWS